MYVRDTILACIGLNGLSTQPAARFRAAVERPLYSALPAVLLLMGVAASSCPAQLLPPPPSSTTARNPTAARAEHTGSFRIAGHVVDSLDGRPLRHAAITLNDTLSSTRNVVAETETDGEGAFSVPNLPAGKFRVQGSAHGYITAAYDEHEGFASAIVTGAGLDTQSLALRLVPAASLSGRVTDEVGDPVRHAMISLFRESTDTGARRITRFRGASTDDLGAYEITRLPPGTYYASLQATPWYATYPPSDSQQNGSGVAVAVDPALNVVYPLTFYPEATDSSGASPIALNAGDRFHADFHLTPQPAMRLTVHVPDPGPNGVNGRSFPLLQQKVFDTYEMVMQQRVQSMGSTVEFAGLAGGNYVLRQVGQAGAAGPERTVDLTHGPLSIDSTPPPAYGPVKLILAMSGAASGAASAEKLPTNLFIALRRVPSGQLGQSDVNGRVRDGQTEISGVEPGDYRIQPLDGRSHVESVSVNGKTTPGALLHVTGDAQTAAITLATGSATITGFARRDGKGASGAMVVLVPAGGDHGVDLYRRDQSDLDGSFRLPNVLPGNYLLVAISDGWSLEWGEPEALAPYLLKAVPITVPTNSSAPIKLEEAVPVQPR